MKKTFFYSGKKERQARQRRRNAASKSKLARYERATRRSKYLPQAASAAMSPKDTKASPSSLKNLSKNYGIS